MELLLFEIVCMRRSRIVQQCLEAENQATCSKSNSRALNNVRLRRFVIDGLQPPTPLTRLSENTTACLPQAARFGLRKLTKIFRCSPQLSIEIGEREDSLYICENGAWDFCTGRGEWSGGVELLD